MDKKTKESVKGFDAEFKTKTPKMQQHLPHDLRGLATNKYGGTQLSTFRGFLGQTYGAASNGRHFTPEERENLARERGWSVAPSSKVRKP